MVRWCTRSEHCKGKYKMGKIPIVCKHCGNKIGEKDQRDKEEKAEGICFTCGEKERKKKRHWI